MEKDNTPPTPSAPARKKSRHRVKRRPKEERKKEVHKKKKKKEIYDSPHKEDDSFSAFNPDDHKKLYNVLKYDIKDALTPQNTYCPK